MATNAWVLDRYNGLTTAGKIEPNDVVLVPLTDLPLSELVPPQSRAESRWQHLFGGVGHGARRATQSGAGNPGADRGREGRALRRCGEPWQPLSGFRRADRARASDRQRQLLEAHVALDAMGPRHALRAREWRKRDGDRLRSTLL